MAVTLACERLVDLVDLGCECDLPDDMDVVEGVLDGSSDFLAALADSVSLGRCTSAYRPCRDAWCSVRWCSCCGVPGIHLPGVDPSVESVWIDGVELTVNVDYRVMVSPLGQYTLVRLNGKRPVAWPSCKDRYSDRTEVGTFEIEIASGYARGQLMTMAAAEIACDTFAMLAGGDHILPVGIVSAIAYGTSMNWRRFSDPTEQKTMDLAGLTMVNRFLQSLPQVTGAEVMSPELDDGWELWQRAEDLEPVAP